MHQSARGQNGLFLFAPFAQLRTETATRKSSGGRADPQGRQGETLNWGPLGNLSSLPRGEYCRVDIARDRSVRKLAGVL